MRIHVQYINSIKTFHTSASINTDHESKFKTYVFYITNYILFKHYN